MSKRISLRQTLAVCTMGILAAAPLAPHAIMLKFSRDAPGALAAPAAVSVGLCIAVILVAAICIQKRLRSPLIFLAILFFIYLFSLRFITFNAANAEVTEYLAGVPIRKVELERFNDEIYCTNSSLFTLSFASKTNGVKFETLRGVWPAYLNDDEIASGTAALSPCSIAR